MAWDFGSASEGYNSCLYGLDAGVSLGFRARLRRASIMQAMAARRTARAAAPIPTPAFAPVVRPLEDVIGCDIGFSVAVAVASDEVVLDEVVVEVVVVELVLLVVDEDVEVDTIPSSVETMAPSPFKTMPRFSAQHVGSLSQQKLPSEQVATRGK
jgi:hypothetical protein